MAKIFIIRPISNTIIQLSEHVRMMLIANIFIGIYDFIFLLIYFFIPVKMLSDVTRLFQHKSALNQR